MKLGEKSISEMTHEEMLEAIIELRGKREELRTEAIRKKREEGKDPKPVRRAPAPAPAAPKEKKSSIDAGTLAYLMGEKDDF